MKRILFTVFIALVSNLTLANIHEWTYQEQNHSRFFEFHNPPIERPEYPELNGVIFGIYCSSEQPSTDLDDNNITVLVGSKMYAMFYGDYSLSLSFDGGESIAMPSDTTSKEGAELWYRIIQEIHQAKKIEAFDGDIKVATFYPKNDSYNKISDGLLKCKAVRDMKKRWSKATESWNVP